MPRLLFVLACERILVDPLDNQQSAMGLFDGFQAEVPEGGTLEANATIQIRWSVVSSWRFEEEFLGQNFEQRLQLISPDQQILTTSIIPFLVVARTHRIFAHANNVSVGQEGELTVALSLRATGGEEWVFGGSYPLDITWVHTPNSLPEPTEPVQT